MVAPRVGAWIEMAYQLGQQTIGVYMNRFQRFVIHVTFMERSASD